MSESNNTFSYEYKYNLANRIEGIGKKKYLKHIFSILKKDETCKLFIAINSRYEY